MVKAVNNILKNKDLFKKGLVHFMSMTLLVQLFGLNFSNKFAYASDMGDKIINPEVSLEQNNKSVDTLKVDEDVVIKYKFAIQGGTDISEDTEFTFKIPEQFNVVKEGTDFVAQTTKIEQLESLMQNENIIQNNSEIEGDDLVNKAKNVETSDNKLPENTVNKERDGKVLSEKTGSETSNDEEKSDLNNQLETEASSETNSEVNEEVNSGVNSGEKSQLNLEDNKEIKEDKQQDNVNADSNSVEKEEKTEAKENPVALLKDIEVNFVKDISVEGNKITIKSKQVSTQQDIKCSFTIKASVNQDKIESNASKTLEFYLNDEKMTKDVSFENKVMPASDFITGVYVSDEKFSDNINDKNCPMNAGFEEYIKQHKIENFDIDSSSIYTCYKFKVDNASSIKKGDSFKLTLPEGISKVAPEKEVSDDLKTDKGTSIGKIYYKDNTVQIVFNEFVSENLNVEGYFWFGRRLEKKEIQSEDKVEFVYKIADEEYTFTIDLKQDVKEPTIKKEGKYDSKEKVIDWKVTVTSGNKEFENFIVYDKLLDLDKHSFTTGSSVVVYEKTVDDEVKINESAFENNELKYTFNEMKKNTTYVFEFQTKPTQEIIDSIGKEYGITNKAELRDGEKKLKEATATVKIGAVSDVITKKLAGGQGNKLTDEIKWEITIKDTKQTIKDAKLYENFSEEQEFVSAEIYQGDSTTPTSTANALLSDDEGKKYIDLGDLNGKYRIIVTTKVKEEKYKELRSKNGKVYMKNSCTLGTGNLSSYKTPEVSKPIDLTVLGKQGSYNKQERTIDWTVTVNSSNNPITNAVFTDIIPEGQEYVDGSFQISDSQKQDGEPDLSDAKPEYVLKDATDSSKGGTLTYKFGSDTRNDKYVIKYKTKISYSDEQYANNKGDIIAKNTAVLNADEFSKLVEKQAEVKIKNFLVQKNYAYNDGDDFITWEVKINQNNVKLDGFTITDELPEGLKLDSDTVKLYKVIYENNGAIKGGKDEVSDSDYSYDYDVSSRTLVVKYNKETSDSYLLSFETPALENQKVYTNTISFESKYDKYITKSESILVRYDEYGAGSRGERGTVSIVKVDKDDENHKLSGAKFELIRKSDNKVMDYTDSESTTDNDGKVIFKRVKYGDYIVREVKAPEGYELAPDQEITVSSQNEDIELTFTDEFIVNKDISIKLIKSFSDNKTGSNVYEGSGAEFTLYSDEACTSPASVSAVNKEATWDGDKYVVTFTGNYLNNNSEYYLKEIKAPSGYTTSSSVYYCNVDSDGNVTYAEKKQNEELEQYSSEVPVCLNVKKNNDPSSGNHHHHNNKDNDDDSDDDTDKQPDDVKPDDSNNNPTNPDNSNPTTTPNSPKDDVITNHQSNTDKNVPQKTESTSSNKKKLPQAGTMLDTKVLIMIGTVLIGLGAIINNRKKYRG